MSKRKRGGMWYHRQAMDSLPLMMDCIGRQPELRSWAEDRARRERWHTFVMRVWRGNRELNLVSRKMDLHQLMANHLVDGLLALPFFPDVRYVSDLGSGAGFPAIPLAVAFPQCTFFLHEKSPRKREFLCQQLDICPNLRVMGAIDGSTRFSMTELIVARAFKPLPALLNLTRSYLETGKSYLLFKGRERSLSIELTDASDLLGDCRVTVQKLNSVTHDERHLLWINPPGPSITSDGARAVPSKLGM